ncbi:universal stress protein [Streptomyces venezuelae]|uniref:universal stress protein n=1 Tax=Streptomyces venezuelae TaxID=54571 RepID=UPI0037A0A06D
MQEYVSRSVVVGVDESAAALAALRWAAASARSLRAPVVAVHAWVPTRALCAPYAPVSELRTPEEDHFHALNTLNAMVARMLELDPTVEIRALLDEGAPAPVLLHHARHALLLALGRGPRDDVTQPALGPVARVCVRNAVCPVVTVPEPSSGNRSLERCRPPEAAMV